MRVRKVVVFAKEPVTGKVKTRLCPPLTFAQSAACHRAFVADTLERLACEVDAELVLAATPDGAAPWLVSAAAAVGARVIFQGSGDLGQRLARVFAREAPEADLVVVGSDSPDLPRAYLDEAFGHVAEGRIVLGPSADGGYYLVGATSAAPSVFGPGIAWGSSDVLRQTLSLARRHGHDVALLPQWRDIDDVEDLRAFARALQEDVDGRLVLPRCRQVIRQLVQEGAGL